MLFTGKHAQLVVMCLQPGEEGEAKFIFNEKEEHIVRSGEAVVVPAGTFHNVINTSNVSQLKLYTVYSPPNHPAGTVHATKAEADAAEHHEVMR